VHALAHCGQSFKVIAVFIAEYQTQIIVVNKNTMKNIVDLEIKPQLINKVYYSLWTDQQSLQKQLGYPCILR